MDGPRRGRAGRGDPPSCGPRWPCAGVGEQVPLPRAPPRRPLPRAPPRPPRTRPRAPPRLPRPPRARPSSSGSSSASPRTPPQAPPRPPRTRPRAPPRPSSLVLLLGLALFLVLCLGLVLGVLVLGLFGALVVALVVRVLGLVLLGLLLLDDLLVALDHVTVLDDAAPALDLVGLEDGARHHVALEVLQLEPRPPSLGAPQVAGALEETLGVVLQDDDDAGQLGSQLVEGDRAVDMTLLALRAPHDALVRLLLEDRGLPLTV